MDKHDNGFRPQNNILGDLVNDFQLADLHSELMDGTVRRVLNVENPTTVECPEEDLIFQLIDGMPTVEHHQQLQQEQQQQQLEEDYAELDEGRVIMANLTGFGAGASIVKGPALMSNQYAIDYSKVYVKIIEQPASHKLRFRYECEGRSAGALQGANSTADNKTFPTIQVVGYQGPAVVVVSCVEEKAPYRAHPHNLVGRGGICKKGVCSMDITNPDMTCQFANLGIQCVRKKDAPASLTKREEIRVDPFKQGFAHKNGSINLNAVRLCFQVFLKNEPKLRALQSVVSSVIYDKRSHSDLQIIEVSDDTSPVEGGKKIMIFCEKVDKNDIEVHFTFTAKSGEPITKKGEFSSSDVHKQYGICLRTPPFHDQYIKERVQVAMHLFKPSDRNYSEPVDFFYDPNPAMLATVQQNNLKNGNLMPHPGMPEPLKMNKRGREPKPPSDDQNDQSSSNVVPRKVPTALYRGGGGRVTVVEDQAAATSIKQEMKIPDISNLWAIGGNNMPQNSGFKSMPFHEIVLNNLSDPPVAHQPINLSSGTPAPAHNIPELPIHTGDLLPDGSFPNIDLNSGDLPMDNLSTSISDMRIDKKLNRGNQNQHAADGGYYPTRGNPHGCQRQSSQLQTPDVSMDESGQKSAMSRRNNLNKF